MVGYDTRPTSPALAAEVVAGVRLFQGHPMELGLVTTPQLHFAVQHVNRTNLAHGDHICLDLDDIYIKPFAKRFTMALQTGMVVDLHVDCANGIGTHALEKLNTHLSESVGGARFRLHLHNTQTEKVEELNSKCGADYVKLNYAAPPSVIAVNKLEARWATIDGDADRLLYFYFQHSTPTPESIVLLDGDRIACLFATFITRLLPSDSALSVGVVQTAYANGASTGYLLEKLHMTVECAKTGVKYVHHKAQQFDIGIYFEANGHGTVLYSSKALKAIRLLEPQNPLAVFQSLTNTSVGDALTDILMVEYALAHLQWSLPQWASIYKDSPSRQIKVAVDEPSVIKTEDVERRVAKPNALKIAVSELVQQVISQSGSRATETRAFVRPSGTEKIARVYAEAPTQEWADWLAQSVAIATHCHAGGIGSEPASPGPMPAKL